MIYKESNKEHIHISYDLYYDFATRNSRVLIKQVTSGLGVTMILLPRLLTLMSFTLSRPVREALDLRFNFDIARVGDLWKW